MNKNIYPVFAEKIVFGTITNVYVDVGTLLRNYNRIEVVNNTGAEIRIAIGSSSTDDAMIVPAGMSKTREIFIHGAVRIKYVGAAPTVNSVIVEAWKTS